MNDRVPNVDVYRDDGPLARVLGGALGRVGLSPTLLLVVAVAPLFVVAAIEGAGASDGVAAAVVAWLVVVGSASVGRPHDRSVWAIPALVRLGEYAALLWLAVLAGRSGAPAAFALLAALAFRHYDLVYRLRQQGTSPPAWLGALALGWEGRVILAWLLLVAGGIPAGYYVLAIVLGVVFVADAVASWARLAASPAGSGAFEEDGG